MTYESWQPNLSIEILLRRDPGVSYDDEGLVVNPQPIYPGDTFVKVTPWYSDETKIYFILSIDAIHMEDRFAMVTCVCDGKLVQTSIDSLSIAKGELKIMRSKDN